MSRLERLPPGCSQLPDSALSISLPPPPPSFHIRLTPRPPVSAPQLTPERHNRRPCRPRQDVVCRLAPVVEQHHLEPHGRQAPILGFARGRAGAWYYDGEQCCESVSGVLLLPAMATMATRGWGRRPSALSSALAVIAHSVALVAVYLRRTLARCSLRSRSPLTPGITPLRHDARNAQWTCRGQAHLECH